MNKDEIVEKWSKEVQVDKNMEILAQCKILIEDYYNIFAHDEFEKKYLIQEIHELVKTEFKKNSITRLIKDAIEEYYKQLGMINFSERTIAREVFKTNLNKLLYKIDSLLNEAHIPSNYLVISRLKNERDIDSDGGTAYYF